MRNDLRAFFFAQLCKNDPNAEYVVAEYDWVDVQFSPAVNHLLHELDALNNRATLPTEDEIMFVFYEVGKKEYGTEKDQLRNWFKHLYTLLFKDLNGPRWGVFVSLLGLPAFIELLFKRFNDPFRFQP